MTDIVGSARSGRIDTDPADRPARDVAHGLPGPRARRLFTLRRAWRWVLGRIASIMPTGLFGRSLIIIVAPVILLQTVIAFVFMERHWASVTNRLSAAVVRDIVGLVDIIETYPQDTEFQTITRIARERFALRVSMLPGGELPPPAPKPFFSILDTALTRELADQVGKPFWVDTVGDSDLLEVRVRLENAVMRVYVPRKSAYASNTHIFLLWMVGAAVVLMFIAILFLRNQIRPIQRLAEAAERFGRGQSDGTELTPRGAREVRRATASFNEMRGRIERAIEQRTTMLAGVSHDLRTVLTRFRLQLALVPQSAGVTELSHDVDEMQSMLQGYLDFARGDAGEETGEVDLTEALSRFETMAQAQGRGYAHTVTGDPLVRVRPVAFQRLLGNLISNALRYGANVVVDADHRPDRHLRITVDDDGPGVPAELREEVFKPFTRLDIARNLDHAGTGLGLAIARDIARSHGGDIALDDAPAGGLRAVVNLPV